MTTSPVTVAASPLLSLTALVTTTPTGIAPKAVVGVNVTITVVPAPATANVPALTPPALVVMTIEDARTVLEAIENDAPEPLAKVTAIVPAVEPSAIVAVSAVVSVVGVTTEEKNAAT